MAEAPEENSENAAAAAAPAPAKGKVINLMDALRKSVSGDSQPAKKTAAKKHGLALVKGTAKKQTHHAAKSTKAAPKRKSA